MSETSEGHESRYVRSLAVFVAIALTLAWVAVTPLWFGDGLQSAFAGPLLQAMMLTPTLAALVVVFFVEKPPRKAYALGLMPLRPARRLTTYLLIALLLPVFLCFASLVMGSILGLYPADFAHFSGYEQITETRLAEAGLDEIRVPISTLVAIQFVNILIGALLLNIVPALGEEIGWRGWLLPKLLRFGPCPAILISGIIWGLWHAPVILLGHNYPGAPGWLAMLAMTVFSVIMGGILGWLRVRGGSVWPAAVAHSTLNASATMFIVFVAKDGTFNPLQANITGWSGWIVPALILVSIIALRGFAPEAPRDIWARKASEPESHVE